MVGALALSLRLGQKKRTLVFLAALVASYVALRISCSRIALIAAPFLSVLIFLVNWRAFNFKWKAAAVILFALASFFTLTDQTIVGRFEEMSEDTGNINNDTRILQWKQGLKAFWDHPVLGNGPSAIPSPPAELLAKSPDGTPAVTWKPYSHSHQAFITVLAESGVIGLIGFLALHLAPWALMWRNLKSSDPEVFFWTWSAAAVTGQFLLNAMTDQLFGMRTLMYIYWTTTATALWLPAYKKLPACKLEEAASGQG
jgi:O-antigen ligase